LWLSCIFLAFALASTSIAGAVQSGTIDTYVGGGNGDGAAAIDATVDPRGLAAVGNPNAPDIYIAEGSANRVRRVDGDTGLIETIAGNGDSGYSGDGGQGQNASLFAPFDVAVDGAGTVYIADVLNHRIRRVGTDGRISTLAGNGQQAYTGEGNASQRALNQPFGVAVGPDGNVYIADLGNHRIRRVSPPGCVPPNCSISTVAGSGVAGLNGDGGPATAASLNGPSDVAFDGNGVMYIVDKNNHRIRRVANGIITTVAGGGASLGDGGPGTQAALNQPSQIDTDSNGNVYIADTGYRRIRMLQAGSLVISTVAGTGTAGSGGDGGSPTRADLMSPYGIAATTPGNFWIAQGTAWPTSQYNRVRRVTNSSVIQTVVGGGFGSGGAAYNAFVDPQGIEAVNAGGALPDLYFADAENHLVRYVDGRTGNIFTRAGTGAPGYTGDGGSAVNATLNLPTDVARDPNNAVVYVADSANNVIRRINTNGTITTVAGDGGFGYDGEGSARQARLAQPLGVDVDNAGVLYIADSSNHRIRKVVGDQMSTVAGNGQRAWSGDGGPATAAALRDPSDVVAAADGTLYIADAGSHRIRRVSASGIITTFAGIGLSGFAGDNGPATAARLYAPTFVSLDSGRNLYIADSTNKRVRRVDAVTQIIETVAGNGQAGAHGDGGLATAASFSEPSGVAVDPSGGHLFIATDGDYRVRHVDFGGAPAPTPTPIVSTASISGQVSYYTDNSVPVPGVAVGLTGPQPQIALTNTNGDYSATLLTGAWEIKPVKQGGRGVAVSSLDAARVLQVVAGMTSMNALQRLACDVTGDGSLSALDGTRILQFSAGSMPQLPAAQACGSDWMFFPRPEGAPNQSVVTPLLSSGGCRPGKIVLSPLTAAARNQDFDGVLLGDCTGNWTPSGAGALRLLAPSGITVHAGSPREARGERLRLPIYVQGAGAFNALDIEIAYDASALTLREVHPRYGAASAIFAVNTDQPDVIAVSLASAEPIDVSAVFILEFDGIDPRITGTAPRLLSAQVDEQRARVVTHGDL
jgi:sugar lactone lactonase YvrE